MTGNNNTATGGGARFSNTTGGANTATGEDALLSNTTGSNNTALGLNAGLTLTPGNANTTGSNNTFIGSNSSPGVPSATSLNNATAIGANALVNCSNCMVLGDSTMPMNVGIRTNAPSEALEVDGNIKIGGAVTNGLIFSDGTKQTTAATGTVTGVTAGDASITIGGTASAPTVAVAAGGITAAKIAAGTILDANISGTANIAPSKIFGTAATLSAVSNTFTGSITPSSFTGSGAGLTSLNASNLTIGTVPDARLSTNVPLKNIANTFTTGAQTILTGALANKGLVVQGASGQTANLQSGRTVSARRWPASPAPAES